MKMNDELLLITATVFIAGVIWLLLQQDRAIEPFTGCMRDVNLKKYKQGKASGYGMGMDGLGIGDIDAGMNGYVKVIKDNTVVDGSPIQRRLKKQRGLTSPLKCTLFFSAYPFIEFYKIDEYDNKLIEIADVQYTKKDGSIYQPIQIATTVTNDDKIRPIEDLINENKYALKVEAILPKVAEGDEIYIGLYHQEGRGNETTVISRPIPLRYFGGEFLNGISQKFSSASVTPCVGMYFGRKASAKLNAPFINLKSVGCRVYNYNGDDTGETTMKAYDATEDGIVSCLTKMDERNRYLGLSNARINCYVSDTLPDSKSGCTTQYGLRVGSLNGNAMAMYELSDRNVEVEDVVETDVRTALSRNGSMNKDITLLRPKTGNIGMTGIYLFRFTVQRPYEVKRFCPDMNYKEFDSQGCESRLTPQSCMNTVHHRYFPDWSLCKTRIDYGDDDAVYDAYKHRVDVRERRDL